MKRLYWRPSRVSRTALTLIAAIALVALLAVEGLPVKKQQPYYAEKVRAAELALVAMQTIKTAKLARGMRIDPVADPAGSGLIGSALTPVTSNTGYLGAKRVSANPNFAAVILELLRSARVGRGDLVAVGLSGSFPALNIATYAALHVVGASPIIVSSAASSEWGANHPELLWLDMERILAEAHVFGFRSVAASRGGIDDRGVGMSDEGLALLDAGIARNGLVDLDPKSLSDAIEKRMRVYEQKAAGRAIRAYVNVGGGTASVGTHIGRKQLAPGLNTKLPRGAELVDSVMLRFLQRGVPVVHLTGVAELARRYGLATKENQLQRVGEGEVYVKTEYNRWLAGAAIAAILLCMLAFLRLDVGLRLLGRRARSEPSPDPEPMI
jgi:poly-gamma-glutamate system protein